jgi:hypothetical protein
LGSFEKEHAAMRKSYLIVLGLILAMAGSARAATSHDITITVTVEYLSVSVSSTAVDLGLVAAGSSSVSGKIDVTNDGNVAENIALQISTQDDKGAWTAGTTIADTGDNKYVLGGILVNDGQAAAVAGDYTDNDVLLTSLLYHKHTDGTASTSALDPTAGNATSLAASAGRDLYFLFKAPVSVSGASAAQSHSITVQLSVSTP